MKKYLFVEVDIPESDHDDDGDPIAIDPELVDLSPKFLTFDEIIKEPDFRGLLLNRGWVDAAMVAKLATDDKLGPRLFHIQLVAGAGNFYQNANRLNGQVIDESTIDNISYKPGFGQVNLFAIEVGIETLSKMSPEHAKTFARIDANNKAIAKMEEDEKKRKEEEKLKRQARKIESAKKLLQAAGVPIKGD